ncbi:MS Related Protein [Caenorhabditis elegans]|uniref:MS Related Protein n=1 Tax=Caenorhabditis elegans TaxID=6239 RepID=Q9XV07_CAEEL|nr:MS Related Protein [Caenorhabditis elegans]CAB04437.1 MS Related Protein [Caenorhabditis elegans]|eukprot:NP_507310.1 Uncharacterized protein CELE_F49H6.8 [Caenorhabditis elegans]
MNPQRGILFACLLVVVTNRGATAQHARPPVGVTGDVTGARIDPPSDKCENPSVNIATTEAPKIVTTAEPAANSTKPAQPNSATGPVVLLTIVAVTMN